ncbi:hypothetical protein BDW62DRAFT_186559 [Aspergillus aurantiobrunneus]
MTNSTRPGHVHTPDPDDTKAADEIIILILGVVVFVTFALGLVSQLSEIPILYPRRREYWDELDEDEYYGSGELNGMNAVSDPENQVGACTAQVPLRSATRYGSITPHIVQVDGITKMVLVVDAATPPRDAALDAYAEWFAGWRRRVEQRRLLDESASLLGD